MVTFYVPHTLFTNLPGHNPATTILITQNAYKHNHKFNITTLLGVKIVKYSDAIEKIYFLNRCKKKSKHFQSLNPKNQTCIKNLVK